MSNETISITRALKELSVLDKRIANSVDNLSVLDVTQGKFKNKALKSNSNIDEFTKQATASFQSVNDLVDRRNNLKRSIVLSNACTNVEIGNETFTVAEAIEKKSSIGIKKNLLTRLQREKRRFDIDIETSRTALNTNLDMFMQQNLGKDRKSDKNDFDNIAKPYIEANETTLVDPIGVSTVIESLENEITAFEADVDIVLSESNAKTTITI